MSAANLFAQANEIAVFVNRSSFSSTTETDPALGATFKLKFDSRAGYGISVDHFFSPNLSLQLLAQTVRANSKVEVTALGTSFSENAGTLDLNEYDAALHWYFERRSAFRPYVGAGVARIQGGKIKIPADLTDSGTAPETISLDDKMTWVADAGVDVSISPKASITFTAKYTPYKTSVGADPVDPVQKLKLDPLTLAAGLRWRF
jgi:outer membrane protein W